MIPVGANGQITLQNRSSTQSVDGVLDVYGYFTQATSGDGIFTATQNRLLVNRTATAIPTGSSVSVTVAGNDGIPTSFGGAVLSLTTTGQRNSGYRRVWPTGQPMPCTTSADNFRANTSTTDLVIAQPGDQGAVSIYNASGGAIQLIVDIQGWFSIDGNDDDGTLTTLPPVDPEETDLTDAPTDPAVVTSEPAAPTDTPGGNAPAGRFCDSGGVYRPTHLGGSYFGAPQSNYNGTNSKESSTFSAEASGTIGIIFSGSLGGTLSELASGIHFRRQSAGITDRETGQFGVRYHPAHKTLNAKYGVWRRRVTGAGYYVYSNCESSKPSTIVSYTPYTPGW